MRAIQYYSRHCFWFNTILILVLFSLIPINDIDPSSKYEFFESLRIVPLCSIFVAAIFFYRKFVRLSGSSNDFYSTDKFYCDLMYATAIIGITFTIHYINWETANIRSAVKVWEISAYAVTFLYTFWIWIVSLKKDMMLIIAKKENEFWEKISYVAIISVSLSILCVITGGHIYITCSSESSFLQIYSTQISIILILITYILFNWISSKVIKLTNDPIGVDSTLPQGEQQILSELNRKIQVYNESFKFGLRYMDRPMMWVFIIMTIYALYLTSLCYFAHKPIMHEMESFFGGAIAFELLLSSVVWAKTKI